MNRLPSMLRTLAVLLLLSVSARAQTTITGTGTVTGTGTITTASPKATPTVTISPTSASISGGTTQQFTATVVNDSFNLGVSWTVTCASNCGSVSPTTSASGVAVTYTAPTVAPFPNNVTLTATSVLNPVAGSSNNVGVLITPPSPPPVISVSVAPTAVSVKTSATQTFTATITNDTHNVNWTLAGAGCSGATCGAVSPTSSASGVAVTYTAPSSVPSPALVTITATSVTDGTKTAAAAITVTAAPVISVNVAPATATVVANATKQFTATVTNDAAGVNWTVTGPNCAGAACGTVSPTSSASGVAVTYTAPGAPLTVTLIASSVTTPAITGSSTITVSVPPIAVGSTPCQPLAQTPAATNTFNCPASSASTIIVPVAVANIDTVSGVQVSVPSGSPISLIQACPPSGPCFGHTAPGGNTYIFYGIGLPLGITTIVVSNSVPAGGQIDIGAFYAQNVNAFDTAGQCSGSSGVPVTCSGNTPTTNPIGAQVTPTNQFNELIATVISTTANTTAIASPFTLILLNGGDGVGYEVTNTPGVVIPNWTTTSGTWSAFTAAFIGGSTSPIVSVAVNPTSSSVATNTTLNVTPTVINGSQGVNWTLTGAGCSGATCGTLSASTTASGVPVTYTAPASAPSPATVTLKATSIDDNTKSATTTITVTVVPIVVSVSPGSASPQVSTVQPFSCTVVNDAASAGCDWVLTGSCVGAACGTISTTHTASGVSLNYTAPGSVPGTVTLTAKSTTDNTKSATATITVVAAPVLTVSISPGSASVQTSATKAFTPTVTNDGGSAGVDWTLTCTGVCGAVSPAHTASGVATTYTAPASLPGSTVTLTAKSTTDATKLATSVITVTAPPNITVTLAPTSASVIANATQQFTATLTNDSLNAGVNITYTGAGCSGATCGTGPSTAASGTPFTYTAPASVPSPATVTITTKSVTDNTKSATATVTITAPVISVSVAPANATVNAGGATQAFTATVVNSASGVNWTLACSVSACGTLSASTSSSGTPITYTSPAASTSLTVTLTATSISDGTKSASAQINVNALTGQFSCAGVPCPAFPGAQGGGAASVGGRGGIVLEVTSLADTGGSCPTATGAGFTGCTLRQALGTAGARYIVFRVSGAITNFTRLQTFQPFMTIAGQTAPGGGVVLHTAAQAQCNGGGGGDCATLWISTHDVVIRYLTYDGSASTPTGPDTGTASFLIESGLEYNIVFDHISARWAGNKNFAYSSNDVGFNISNTSTQWNLIYEPNLTHPVGIGTTYVSAGSANATHDNDAHHNMLVNIDHRLPLQQSGWSYRWVNNLVYVWGFFASLQMGGGANAGDYIGNKYVDGPSSNFSSNSVHVFIAERGDTGDNAGDCPGTCERPGFPVDYFLNNVGRTGANFGATPVTATHVVNDAGQLSMLSIGSENAEGSNNGPWPSSGLRSTPLPTQTFPINADPVENLDNVILATVGNSQHLDCNGNFVSNRDSMDTRIIAQYQNRTGGQAFTGQFSAPAIPAGTLCPSTLHDGIYDGWRTRYNEHRSYNTVDPVTGLTIIEDFLNGLVP